MVKIIKNSLFILGCLFWFGCGKYKVQHVVKQEKALYTFEEKKDIVELSVRAFEQEEFKEYLSSYQPIQLHIKNKTNKPLLVTGYDISLPLASLQELKKHEPKLFFINFIPCGLVSILGFFFWWEIVIPSMAVLGLCAGQQSLLQYERSLKYIKQNTLFPQDTLTVEPLSTVDKLIFVKRSLYTPRWTISFSTSTVASVATFNVFITTRTINVFSVH